jgi:gliding motility-associated-like protein
VKPFTKNKTAPLAFIFLMCTVLCHAQLNWLKKDGGSNNDEALDVAIDNLGNNYSCGYYNASALFNNQVLTNQGVSDIYLTKRNAVGSFTWVQHAGGALPDRAQAVAIDNSSNVIITGYFTSQANFGSMSLSANSSSQDAFVAKYSSTGSLLWVIRMGGENEDSGFGIDTDAAGNIYVTGQYSGTGTFGSFSSTSTWDPAIGAFGMDIFICKISPTGAVEWLKSGAASDEDRGNDLSVSLDGNVYVTGFFSGDITFSQTYVNDVENVGFVLKLDSDGNEIWMQLIAAGFLLCEDIECTSDNGFLLSGNYSGQMLIVESTSVTFDAVYDYNLFVLKFNSASTLLWFSDDGSDNPMNAKAMALDINGSVYVAGTFQCDFTEYHIELGGNLYYSAGFRDIFITKFNDLGNRIWTRQYGGPGDEQCQAVAAVLDNQPIVSGGFDKVLNVPLPAGSTLIGCTYTGAASDNHNLAYCGYSDYGNYFGLSTNGSRDAFVMKPFHVNAPPYDYVDHTDLAACPGQIIPFCLEECQDSILICQSASVTLPPIIAGEAGSDEQQVIGPTYNFTYSSNTGCANSSSSNEDDFEVCLINEGWVWMTIQREDGCTAPETDSVYVDLESAPVIATINDSFGAVLNSQLSFDEVDICASEDLFVATEFDGELPYYWTNGIDVVYNDSLTLMEDGTWTFVIENEFGCNSQHIIDLEFHTIPAGLEHPGHLTAYEHGFAVQNDTIRICPGEIPTFGYIENSTGSPQIQDVSSYWTEPPQDNIEDIIQGNMLYTDDVFEEGWSTYLMWLNYDVNSCEYFTETITVYLDVLDVMDYSLNLVGPSMICPGIPDTMFIDATEGMDVMIGFNGAYSQATENYFLSQLPGLYSVIGNVVDNGCVIQLADYVNVLPNPYPLIVSNPSNGVVCPGETVELSAPEGQSYLWIGPDGNIIGTNQTYEASVPGYYHCIHTNNNGCSLESNFLEIYEYSSAYLSSSPLNYFCEPDPIELVVQTNSASSIEWLAPITSDSLHVWVSEPGIYSVAVTLCNIVDTASIQIFDTPADASFQVFAPEYFCEGDTIELHANDLSVSFEWQPDLSTDSVLIVTHAGSYSLQVTDTSGCWGESEIYQAIYFNIPEPLVSDATVCLDSTAQLHSASDFNSIWLDENLNEVAQGENFTTAPISDATNYSIYCSVLYCVSDTINVQVSTWPLMDVTAVTPNLCQLAVIDFLVNDAGFSFAEWDFDDGSFSNEASPSHSYANPGVYDVTVNGISQHGCYQEMALPIEVMPKPNANFTISEEEGCEPFSIDFADFSAGAAEWSWSSDESVFSNAQNPSHIFYSNFCDADTIQISLIVESTHHCRDTLNSEIHVFPRASSQFELDTLEGCAPTSAIQVTNLSSCFTQSQWVINDELQSEEIVPVLSVSQIGENVVQLISNNQWFCSDTAQTIFVLHPLPVISMNAEQWDICAGEEILFSAYVENGESYWWDFGDGPSQGTTDTTLLFYQAGNYGVAFIASTTFGCRDTLNLENSIQVNPLPEASFEATPLLLDIYDPHLEFVDQSIGNISNWHWQFGDGSEAYAQNVTHDYSTLEPTVVMLTVTDIHGCQDTALFPVNLSGDLNVFVPNSFTPASSQYLNDAFGPMISEIDFLDEYYFSIFDRWGDIVFATNDPTKFWDGSVKGGEYFVQEDIYVWKLEYKSKASSEKVTKQGHVTIIR